MTQKYNIQKQENFFVVLEKWLPLGWGDDVDWEEQ